MDATLGELADLVGGRLVGDAELVITGTAILRDAAAGEITLADKPELSKQLADSPAAAVVVSDGVDPAGKPHLVVDSVAVAFTQIVARFHPPRRRPTPGVHPAAAISPTARLGEDVSIHAGATVGEGVQIGPRAVISAGVHLMAGTQVGADAVIYPGAVLYENTIVGPRAVIHAGAVLGAYGFGYETVNGRHQLSAQLGYVELQADVEVGAGSTIDRGTFGPTLIGEGTKIDNQVMIAHNCRIGRHNLICSQVGVAGSSVTGDYVVLAGQVGVCDHVEIGSGAVLGAKAGVMNNIPAGQTYAGIPAKPIRDQKSLHFAWHKLPELRKRVKQLERVVAELQSQRESRGEAA